MACYHIRHNPLLTHAHNSHIVDALISFFIYLINFIFIIAGLLSLFFLQGLKSVFEILPYPGEIL